MLMPRDSSGSPSPPRGVGTCGRRLGGSLRPWYAGSRFTPARGPPTSGPGGLGGGPASLGAVVLRRGAVLDGEIVDSAGDPVAGARIRVISPNPVGSRFAAAAAE